MLLEAGADVNAVNARGWRGSTPLDAAVGKGEVAATRMLLEAGANPSDDTFRAARSPFVPFEVGKMLARARQAEG